jgi:hypothetical protein
MDHRFPNRWIGRGGAQNCPPQSPDVFHVWGYLKTVVCACKMNTIGELLRWILSAARRRSNAAVFHKVTGVLVTTLVSKCVRTDGGHVERLRACNCAFKKQSINTLYTSFYPCVYDTSLEWNPALPIGSPATCCKKHTHTHTQARARAHTSLPSCRHWHTQEINSICTLHLPNTTWSWQKTRRCFKTINLFVNPYPTQLYPRKDKLHVSVLPDHQKALYKNLSLGKKVNITL